MKYNIRFFLLTFICILSLTNVSFSGSYYQISGLGAVNYLAQADAMSRGGTLIGIQDHVAINTVNPAGLIFINITKITTNIAFENTESKWDDLIGKYNYYNLQNVNIAVPIISRKLVVALGLSPITKSDFSAESDFYLNNGSKYTKKIINKGGLNRFSLSLATSFKNKIFCGLTFNHNFGKIEENWKVIYEQDTYVTTSDKIISKLWGPSINMGVMVNVKPNFTVGAIFNQGLNLSANNNIEHISGIDSEINKTKLKIPYYWGLGTSYILKEKIRFSSDFIYRPWSGIKFNDKNIQNANDGFFWAMGIEKLSTTKRIVKYYERISYKLGFNFIKSNYQDINGNDVNKYMVTTGIGLPYYHGWGRIDIALGYGKCGNLDKNLVEESTYKLMLSISGGEKWFIRRRK